MSKLTGGGANKYVDKPVRYGDPARKVSELAVAGLGSKRGTHATDGGDLGWKSEPFYQGSIPNVGSQPLGNQVAATTKCGPGGSRKVYGSGSQGKR
jgi:hypothetical protein